MTVAKLLFLASFSALAACAATTSDGAASSSNAESTTKSSTCVSNMPIQVWSYAAHLALGQPVGAQGAAGSMVYTFAGGNSIRWDNVYSSVAEVKIGGNDLALDVAASAEANALGSFVGTDGAPDGTVDYTFARGVVHYSDVDTKVEGVSRTDGFTPVAGSALEAPTATGTACLDQMPADVWAVAAGLDFGPALVVDDGQFYMFSSGAMIQYTDGKIASVAAYTSSSIEPAVAEAAAKAGLGAFINTFIDAPDSSYRFDRGIVHWNTDTSTVTGLTGE